MHKTARSPKATPRALNGVGVTSHTQHTAFATQHTREPKKQIPQQNHTRNCARTRPNARPVVVRLSAARRSALVVLSRLLQLLLHAELVGVTALLLAAVHRAGVEAGVAPATSTTSSRNRQKVRLNDTLAIICTRLCL